mgnify:CR=1 FL=1
MTKHDQYCEFIDEEVTRLLKSECDPFHIENFLKALFENNALEGSYLQLEQALIHCDVAKVGNIIMTAVENYWTDVAENITFERYNSNLQNGGEE